jgi:hypothetical protein
MRLEAEGIMKIILYEKKRNEPDSMFQPATNERLAWLIYFISQIEIDKGTAKIRLDALLCGKQINTDLSSFLLKIVD